MGYLIEIKKRNFMEVLGCLCYKLQALKISQTGNAILEASTLYNPSFSRWFRFMIALGMIIGYMAQ